MAQRNAASVLPEPVGATTRVLSPLAMAAHASVWAAVGAANVPVNHSRVSSLKRASGLGLDVTGHLAIVPAPTDKPSRDHALSAADRADIESKAGMRATASSRACAHVSAT